MAVCTNTSVASLLAVEVASWLKERRHTRKAAPAVPRGAHTTDDQRSKWISHRVRKYVLQLPCGAASSQEVNVAVRVLSGDVEAAEAAITILRDNSQRTEEELASVRECAERAPEWRLTDAEKLQLVDLRCTDDVSCFLALKRELSEADTALLQRAIGVLLPEAHSHTAHGDSGESAGIAAPAGASEAGRGGATGSDRKIVRFEDHGTE